MYKNQKILINSEKHFNQVACHLESLGYKKYSIRAAFSPDKINFIVTYGDGYYSFYTKEVFDKDPYEEVGEVCTYLKDVPKKKFGFEVDGDYLVAVDEKGDSLAYLLTSYAKGKLEGLGYDTSSYKWNDNGSIKII